MYDSNYTKTKTAEANGVGPKPVPPPDAKKEWITGEEASAILGVSKTTVSRYAYDGHFEARRKGNEVTLYDYPGVLAFAIRYPVGPGGRRKIGKKAAVSPYIYARPTVRGENRYVVQIAVPGKKAYVRTFRTLAGAENARDRYLARRDEERNTKVEEKTEAKVSTLRSMLRLFRPTTNR